MSAVPVTLAGVLGLLLLGYRRMAAFASAGFGGMMIAGGLWALWSWL